MNEFYSASSLEHMLDGKLLCNSGIQHSCSYEAQYKVFKQCSAVTEFWCEDLDDWITYSGRTIRCKDCNRQIKHCWEITPV